MIKRGRGRPRKIISPITQENKSQNISLPIYTNIRDLKRQIRELRKLKLQCRPGTKERIELHRKMTALKKQLKEVKEITPTTPNISPITYEPKKRTPELIIPEENCSDSNGCSYYGYCKAINKNGLINVACYNPKYIIEKLARKCSQLINKKGEE